MKTRILLSALAFLAVCALSAFMAWCGGITLDHRGPEVGTVVLLGVSFGTVAAILTFTEL